MEGLKGRGRKIIGLGKLHYCICIRSSADSCTWYSFIMIKIRWRRESSPICKKKRSCMWRKGIKWWLYYQQTRKNPINILTANTYGSFVSLCLCCFVWFSLSFFFKVQITSLHSTTFTLPKINKLENVRKQNSVLSLSL